jgi:hypothetical protein
MKKLLIIALLFWGCPPPTEPLPEDCAGVAGGTAVEDCAGVCGGDTVVDECGVCGGDNSSCGGFCEEIQIDDPIWGNGYNTIKIPAPWCTDHASVTPESCEATGKTWVGSGMDLQSAHLSFYGSVEGNMPNETPCDWDDWTLDDLIVFDYDDNCDQLTDIVDCALNGPNYSPMGCGWEASDGCVGERSYNGVIAYNVEASINTLTTGMINVFLSIEATGVAYNAYNENYASIGFQPKLTNSYGDTITLEVATLQVREADDF